MLVLHPNSTYNTRVKGSTLTQNSVFNNDTTDARSIMYRSTTIYRIESLHPPGYSVTVDMLRRTMKSTPYNMSLKREKKPQIKMSSKA